MTVILPSCDPRAFGPGLWQSLHVLAANYPECASESTRRQCRRFLTALAHMLPCEECGRHFRAYLRSVDLRRAVKGRRNLVRLLVDAHNDVTSHTQPERAPFSIQDAARLYAHAECSLPLANVWGED